MLQEAKANIVEKKKKRNPVDLSVGHKFRFSSSTSQLYQLHMTTYYSPVIALPSEQHWGKTDYA